MSKFDRKICISNIYALAKERNVKIGDLEKEGGMSVGYLSRLSKEDNTSVPSIEFIASAAEQLGVSVESLISHDFTQLTPTERYLLNFIEKLQKDTMTDKLYWVKQTTMYLNTLEADEYGGEVGHPLFDIFWESGETEPTYCSRYGQLRTIAGDCFFLRLTSWESVYLMNVNDPDEGEVFELYLVQNGIANALCQSGGSSKMFCFDLEMLYGYVSESCKHPKLESSVMSAIDAFMENRLQERESLNDDTPF